MKPQTLLQFYAGEVQVAAVARRALRPTTARYALAAQHFTTARGQHGRRLEVAVVARHQLVPMGKSSLTTQVPSAQIPV
jgi:hypothetical protein